jgi:hypothetical protein
VSAGAKTTAEGYQAERRELNEAIVSDIKGRRRGVVDGFRDARPWKIRRSVGGFGGKAYKNLTVGQWTVFSAVVIAWC